MSATTAPIRVLIADDHPMFRRGLVASFAGSPEVQVVGEAQDGEQLLALAAEVSPDVVVTDLSMPSLDGIKASQRLLASHPSLGLLILTMHEDDERLFSALRAGARGYLLKGADRDDIVRAIQAVHAGDAIYAAPVARRIVDFFTGAHDTYAAQVFPDLTDRERDVLQLVSAGAGNHEIARRLGLSDKTVRNHVSAILGKLQARDRAAAVALARNAGLGKPPR